MAAAACASMPLVARHLAVPCSAPNRTCAGASTSYAPSQAARQPAARLQQRRRHSEGARRAAAPRSRRAVLVQASGGEIAEVDDLKGIRVLKNEDDTPRVEYLVKWKDGSPDTW